MAQKLTVNIKIGDLELNVSGYYEQGEETVRYEKDGSGYPGSDDYFEVNSIIFEGTNITTLISELDKIEDIKELAIATINNRSDE